MKKSLLLLLASMLMGTGAFAEWVKPKLSDYGIQNPPSSGVLVQGELGTPGAYGYLFNEESGGFFVGANEHGTRASVSEVLGQMVFLEDRNDEYYWSIISFVLQGNAKNSWRRTCVDSPKSIWVDNNYGPYVDTWTITQLGNGKFTIGNDGEVFDGMTLGVYTDKAPAGDSRLYLANKATAENFGNTWYFVNDEEYTNYTNRVKEIYDEYYEKANIYSHAVDLGKAINDAEGECANPLLDLSDEKAVYNNTESTLEQLQEAIKRVNQKVVAWRNENKYSKATYENPMDVTSFITNPSFEDGDLNGWTVNTSGDTGAKMSSNATYHCDNTDGNYLFNTWDDHRGYPISQRLENMPNGVYKLGALVTSTTTNAFIFANGGIKDANGDLVDAYSTVKLQDHPEAKAQTEWFTLGGMWFAVEDGTITIGAVGAGADGKSYVDGGYSWYKADNFTLTYYGNQAEGYHRVLEDAEREILDWWTGRQLSLAKGQILDKALAAIPRDKSGKTVDELKVLLKNLYAAYAEAKEPDHYRINESKLITANATDLDGVEAVVTDPTGEKTWAVFTGNDGQDINANCTSVYDWSSKSEYSKITFYAVDGQPDNVYYIKFVNINGNGGWYNPRGDWHGNQGCMNVTGNGTGLFVGGITDKNGQDVVNGALWQVTKTADGYTFYNIGKEKYAVPGIGVTSTETSLKLYSEFEEYDPKADGSATVVAKINAIGTVEYTEASKALIDAAREAYDALPEDQKAQITAEQLKVLTDAEAAYANLKAAAEKAAADQAAADAVVETINAIGTVEYTEASKALIDAAREAYDALTDDQQALITEAQLKVLTDAEAAYANLKAAAENQAAADAVVEKINAIGTVAYTEASKALIDAAREAYDALTEAQQALITEAQLKVLTDAEAAYAELKAAAEKAAADQAAATAAVETINAIGTVEYTEASKALIDAAREAYDALTEDQQALITEAQLKVLTDAEAAYAELEEAAKYATLTFAIAEQTGIGTQVKKGDVTLDITAEECWAVATLTVNNEDKLADLAEGKLTFNMQGDATVAVTYKWADEENLYTESDITSGIYSTKAGVKAYVKDGKIYVNANAAVRVYTTTGALIATKAPSAETAIFTVPAGTYIIKVGNEGIKVKVGE